jgi:CheY-like chemotaxis protein
VQSAVESARQKHPDLILVSLGGPPRGVILTALHIRERAQLGENVPVVVFCIVDIDEGGEVAIGQNAYVTRPDNFNQLRNLLARLLKEAPNAA